MRAFVVDAFAERVFGGNQAGVVVLEAGESLSETLMLAIAAELKHSETAFVRRTGDGEISIRYFTPTGEIELCGHATVASFSLLRELGMIGEGRHTLDCPAGRLPVLLEKGAVWLTISPTAVLRELDGAERGLVLAAYGLDTRDAHPRLPAAVVNSGLSDIMLPLRDRGALSAARQDAAAVKELSREYGVTGVHMFCPGGEGVLARCRNFAPLWGIDEECATGTANAGLTRLLFEKGLVPPGAENIIIQGEDMGRPSTVRSRVTLSESGPLVEIGGGAVVSMELLLRLPEDF